MAKTMIFGGKKYYFWRRHSKEESAKKEATKFRKQGRAARVYYATPQNPHNWDVYVEMY